MREERRIATVTATSPMVLIVMSGSELPLARLLEPRDPRGGLQGARGAAVAGQLIRLSA